MIKYYIGGFKLKKNTLKANNIGKQWQLNQAHYRHT